MKRNSIDLPPQEISRRLVSPFTTKPAPPRARTLGSQRRKLQRMPAFNARRQSLCIFCNQISPHRLAPASTNERIASHFVIRSSSHFEDNWYHRERTGPGGDGNSCRQRLLVPTLARSEVWQRFTGSQKNLQNMTILWHGGCHYEWYQHRSFSQNATQGSNNDRFLNSHSGK